MRSKQELQCPICDQWVNQTDWADHGKRHKEIWVPVIRLRKNADTVSCRYSYYLPATNKTWNGVREVNVRIISVRKAA